jgi:hypothetical protein
MSGDIPFLVGFITAVSMLAPAPCNDLVALVKATQCSLRAARARMDGKFAGASWPR